MLVRIVAVLVAARRSGEPKRLIFKGGLIQNRRFGTGPGVREVQNGSLLKAGLVQNRHFLGPPGLPARGAPLARALFGHSSCVFCASLF